VTKAILGAGWARVVRRTGAGAMVLVAALAAVGPTAWADGAEAPDDPPQRVQPYQGEQAAPPTRQAAADEAQFLRLANNERANQGAAPLATDSSLTNLARWWAANMSDQGTIFHNYQLPNDVSEDWLKLGENVGKGPDVPSLHQAFVNSARHYWNMIDPAYAYVGIGVVIDSKGVIYVVFDFMQLQPPPPPPPTAVASPPVTRPVVSRQRTLVTAAAPLAPPVSSPPRARPAAPAPTVVPAVPPPQPPAVARATVASGLQSAITQLRSLDATRDRPPPARAKATPAKAPAKTPAKAAAPKIDASPSTFKRDASSPAPRPQPADPAEAYKQWLPPSYCEGSNKMHSRMC
jgi:uncharacterized protein YkwD